MRVFTGTHDGDMRQLLDDYLAVSHNADGTPIGGPLLVTNYGAVGDGVTNDTVAIQAALTAAHAAGGGTVYLPATTANVYKITASLVIYSNTTLRFHDAVTLRLASGSNSNMIHNAAWVAGSGRDSNIKITGGTWDRGNNLGAGQQTHNILMQRVDGLYIGYITALSTDGKYFICPYACTDFVIEEMTCTVASAAVQCDGACSGGRISGIYGTTGDDSVALTPIEWTAYQNGDFGDITDIVIERIYTTALGVTKCVKVLGGSYLGTPYACRRITIRNVAGRTADYLICLGGDTTQSATSNGHIIDLTVDNVANLGTGGVIRIVAGGTGQLESWTFSHIAASDNANFKTVQMDATSGALNLNLLVIRDCYWVTTNTTSPVEIKGGAVVANLLFESCYFKVQSATYLIDLNSASTAITAVRFMSCRLGTGAGLIHTNGSLSQQVSNVFITDLTVDTASWVIGDFVSGITTNLFIDGLRVTTVSGLLFNRSGSAVNLLVGNGFVGTNAGKFGSTGTVNLNSIAKATPTYSASITPIASDAPWQTITVTNATAFAINAPTNPPDSTHSAELTIEISNTSGGAMGVITWNAAFKFAGFVWANPATANKRFARFEWNGTAWICTGAATADYT